MPVLIQLGILDGGDGQGLGRVVLCFNDGVKTSRFAAAVPMPFVCA